MVPEIFVPWIILVPALVPTLTVNGLAFGIEWSPSVHDRCFLFWRIATNDYIHARLPLIKASAPGTYPSPGGYVEFTVSTS